MAPFRNISDVNITANSPLVPCILSGDNVRLTGVIKVFCDHPNLTLNHLTNIPSRPLTGITKGPEYAVNRSFINSIQADMNFSHCLSAYCFRGKWREIFREKCLVALRNWVFSPGTGPQESKSKLVKHWQYWEKYSPGLLNPLSIEGPITSKKVKRRPPIQTKEFRSAHSS